MKKQLVKICIILIFLLTLCSCTFNTYGDSLEAFTSRMNEINKQYNMTSQGYIIDKKEQTFTKFFSFSEKEIMLNFKYDHKFRLTEMNLIFDTENLHNNTQYLKFIEDCIWAFCYNKALKNNLLEELNFQKTITKISKETISAEADNIKIEIDTTQLGTVVTVYKTI